MSCESSSKASRSAWYSETGQSGTAQSVGERVAKRVRALGTLKLLPWWSVMVPPVPCSKAGRSAWYSETELLEALEVVLP